MTFATVAQLVERLHCKQLVAGSSPVCGSIYGSGLWATTLESFFEGDWLNGTALGLHPRNRSSILLSSTFRGVAERSIAAVLKTVRAYGPQGFESPLLCHFKTDFKLVSSRLLIGQDAEEAEAAVCNPAISGCESHPDLHFPLISLDLINTKAHSR
jgi:hypothetical protein